jgi:2-polyprenyl-3-methyl-5-hydroxy-6-metoxy-1,4-benzoquinol methylase
MDNALEKKGGGEEYENTRSQDSLERFTFEFTHFPEILPENKAKFLKLVYPHNEGSFKDKSVLDAGCGNGRNSLWVLKFGARELAAFDYHPATVAVAKQNLKDFPNAKVFLNSIYEIPYRDKFDVVMCIGVLQHLHDPETALKNLVAACKPGGTVVIWTYGKENNGFITTVIDPIRFVTSRLPIFIPYGIAYILSLILYSYLKIFRPKNQYLQLMSTYSFRLLFNIVFDHLIPKISKYWARQELVDLFGKYEVKDVQINSVAGNTWTVVATKK